MPYNVKWYGWARDLPDHRDLVYSAPVKRLKALPPKVDLTATRLMPAVYDQSELGSCTGNAIAAAVHFARRKEKKKPDFVPSRLFIYWNERKLEGTVDADAGAQIRDGMKVVAKLGICPSDSKPKAGSDWPYDMARFRDPPPKACFTFALDNQITSYQRIPQVLSQMKACLAEGFPFVFGIMVYESFESAQVAKSGVVDLPGPREKPVGGHAVMAVATMTPPSASWCATAGAATGDRRATAPCPTPTSATRSSRPTSGPCGRRSERRVAMRSAALGMRPHTGWAAALVVAGTARNLEVVARRRIDMATTFEAGAVYHASQGLFLSRAEELIRSAEERFEHAACEVIAALAAELRAAGLEVVASAVVGGQAKALPPLESILRSHALVHAAEGELYRRVVARASEGCGVPALLVSAKEIAPRAAAALGLPEAQLAARLAALGKAAGRPWAQDQKECALAACIALAEFARAP